MPSWFIRLADNYGYFLNSCGRQRPAGLQLFASSNDNNEDGACASVCVGDHGSDGDSEDGATWRQKKTKKKYSNCVACSHQKSEINLQSTVILT